MLQNNIILDTDAYKITHHLVQPENQVFIYSYGESRGGKYPAVLWFGLRMIIIDHLRGRIVEPWMLEEAEEQVPNWFGEANYLNRTMWETIINKYDGHLPIRIKAAPEGLLIPTGNVLFTIEPLDPIVVPLIGHIETLLMHVWYPTTIATRVNSIRGVIDRALEKSGTPALAEYMCHDFGYRGSTSQQSAMRAGLAHLLRFVGSDTLVADRAIHYYYGNPEGRLSLLKSVLATEHSVATSFGPGQGEFEYVEHILRVTPSHLIASCVIDSYDAFNFTDAVVGSVRIKKLILDRTGKFILRPDSGNPNTTTLVLLQKLERIFGATVNDKGYRVLHPSVGILWGDGLSEESLEELYDYIMDAGWSADNLVVGFGGGLHQKGVDRDTQKFAIKASYGTFEENGVLINRNLQKSPSGQGAEFKKSKAGQLKLHKTGTTSYTTIQSSKETPMQFNAYADTLETVYELGEIKNYEDFMVIRNRR